MGKRFCDLPSCLPFDRLSLGWPQLDRGMVQLTREPDLDELHRRRQRGNRHAGAELLSPIVAPLFRGRVACRATLELVGIRPSGPLDSSAQCEPAPDLQHRRLRGDDAREYHLAIVAAGMAGA